MSNLAAAVPAAAGGGGNHGLGMPILPHLGELIFGCVFFAVFLIFIIKYVVPKMETAYTQRVDAIQGDMSRAEKSLAEAEALKAEYQRMMEDARHEANQMRERGREEGAAIVAEMRAQASAEAERIIESARRQVEAERASAMAELKNDVGRISTDLAGRIVGESLQDDARRNGVIERFLQQLEDGTLQRETSTMDRAGR
ncbi:F0F1 ATP synthase subunit B [Dermatophilus congolensis]|nr:F0F1 ATP synthase subunit B [Dermatophilus congolensis]MBO3128715.1 F0F1 ATP synthase subunit B [Dermatophilus congolensis]MBO3132648.1 F0F1 ATP synthase subunit B [Dermatophilus congolensis]MBO3133191.1 F0F1 ATP synthase subunit B [Dermatophilus congolensis]MBO3135426.1 F0F1 ATP synthase subunit B [Dermatophilus congolensis]MBO3137666.1 F0F1 ATP synthase subunit B [Dermatophilus congolensis]